MIEEFRIRQRRRAKPSQRGRTLKAAFKAPPAGATGLAGYPGFSSPDDEGNRRQILSGTLAALFHFGGIGILVLFASLAPVIEEHLIPVQLLKEEPPPPPEPAAAPKALAERRALPFAPQIQSITPQIVNPHIIAEASPAIQAEAFQMDAVNSVTAPTQITRSATVVERVSAVNSIAKAQASAVDVARVAGPAVRGPTKIDAPIGASVGPRKVNAAAVAPTMGTGLTIGSGSGSSVAEGVLSNRDVVGSPDGALVVTVDTAVGDGYLRGSGEGDGTSVVSNTACMALPEVQSYMTDVRTRIYSRWVLPPGVGADETIKLRFRLDAAGSASNVSVVRSGDNSLGASAVDAIRTASPFPPIPDSARCLTRVPIVGTFKNPVAG